MMDELNNFIENTDNIEFIVSLDYIGDLYSCSEWADFYIEFGSSGSSPLILNDDIDFNGDDIADHQIWDMFANYTYSAYAFLDHHMVLRYKFDMPNLYHYQYIYIPNLINSMYGCTDMVACNYNQTAVIDDGSCNYSEECVDCSESETQLECMDVEGCMWMGNHCMETSDDCINYSAQLECMDANGCYWMGDHCMSGDPCTDPLAYNYNHIADLLGQEDNSTCQYSQYITFGCTYSDAINYNSEANVDNGSCEFVSADLNSDGIIDILDILIMINIILDSE